MQDTEKFATTQKLIIEFELTGNEEQFARCQDLAESFLELLCQLNWGTEPGFRAKICAKEKLGMHRRLHKDVQLPYVNRAAS